MSRVFILATVRKAALLDAALLIFKTIRTGFPAANLFVCGNNLNPEYAYVISQHCNKVGANFRNIAETSHDAWIEKLIQNEILPFWICDTDVVFFDRADNFFSCDKNTFFAGRYEPTFQEEWTRTTHIDRLHTCLMFINPVELRNRMREHMCKIPEPWRDSAYFPLIRQTFVPKDRQEIIFYDTCAGIFHAIGGTKFSDLQNATFEHLHCATYADLVSKYLSCNNLEQFHRCIYANPILAKGLKESQDKYYDKRAKALCQRSGDN